MTMLKPKNNFESVECLFMEAVASRVLWESVRLKLYDLLETPRSLAQIAKDTGTVEPVMEAFLDLLAFRGLVTKSGEGYVNTSLASEFLVSTSPFYQGTALELHQDSYNLVIRDMASMLRGEKQNRQWTGQQWTDPAMLRGMAQNALRGSLQDAAAFITALPDFSHIRMMADIGGNHGRYTMTLLDRNPELVGVILDLHPVIPAIETLCREAGYGDRLSAEAFDLRTDAFPDQRYDLILTSHVLHMFAETLDTVIRRIADGLKPGGWFVAHHMAPEGGASRSYKTIRELITRLLGHPTHYLAPDKLEMALRRAGFTDFQSAFTGCRQENRIFAARKS